MGILMQKAMILWYHFHADLEFNSTWSPWKQEIKIYKREILQISYSFRKISNLCHFVPSYYFTIINDNDYHIKAM